jgi:antitoxin component YwqK of YwqJK toxin-antitoxin module
MKKDITPKNKQGRGHGYFESYYPNGLLSFKGNFINGKKDGCWESYSLGGQLWYRGKFINGKVGGLWIWNGYKTIKFYL